MLGNAQVHWDSGYMVWKNVVKFYHVSVISFYSYLQHPVELSSFSLLLTTREEISNLNSALFWCFSLSIKLTLFYQFLGCCKLTIYIPNFHLNRLRKVKMDQRKLMDNANTITDMAKVKQAASSQHIDIFSKSFFPRSAFLFRESDNNDSTMACWWQLSLVEHSWKIELSLSVKIALHRVDWDLKWKITWQRGWKRVGWVMRSLLLWACWLYISWSFKLAFPLLAHVTLLLTLEKALTSVEQCYELRCEMFEYISASRSSRRMIKHLCTLLLLYSGFWSLFTQNAT